MRVLVSKLNIGVFLVVLGFIEQNITFPMPFGEERMILLLKVNYYSNRLNRYEEII